jgi:hypothetical protein
VKSLEFLKPTLATTLAIVLAWLLSVRPAQAGYTVTLQQVGPDVVATGSGAIDLTGLYTVSRPYTVSAQLWPGRSSVEGIWEILTGQPTTNTLYAEGNLSGPTMGFGFFGSGGPTLASSGSGDMVGIYADVYAIKPGLIVPAGYVSGTALSDSATYNNATLATLGVTPGTYVWTWGKGGANQKFTLRIGVVSPTPTPVPAPTITISSSPAMVNEGGSAAFTISASTVNPSQPVTVNFAMGGKTINGVDYTLSEIFGQVTIPAGTSSATVTLNALTDNLKEKREKAIMTLRQGVGYNLSRKKQSATVTIANVQPTATPAPSP